MLKFIRRNLGTSHFGINHFKEEHEVLSRRTLLHGEDRNFKRVFKEVEQYLQKREAIGDDITKKFLSEGPSSFNAFRRVFASTYATSKTMFRWEDEGEHIQCHLFDMKKILRHNDDLRTSSGHIELSGYHFSHADFMMAKLDGFSIKNPDLWRGVNFSCVTFENCIFENVRFKYCNFMGATFKNCVLKDVMNRGCRFSGASIIDSEMEDFNFNESDCRGLIVERTNWDGEDTNLCFLRETGYDEEEINTFSPYIDMYGRSK